MVIFHSYVSLPEGIPRFSPANMGTRLVSWDNLDSNWDFTVQSRDWNRDHRDKSSINGIIAIMGF